MNNESINWMKVCSNIITQSFKSIELFQNDFVVCDGLALLVKNLKVENMNVVPTKMGLLKPLKTNIDNVIVCQCLSIKVVIITTPFIDVCMYAWCM